MTEEKKEVTRPALRPNLRKKLVARKTLSEDNLLSEKVKFLKASERDNHLLVLHLTSGQDKEKSSICTVESES